MTAQQSPLAELIGRARNPLNFLLLSLAAVSFVLGDQRAAAVITVMPDFNSATEKLAKAQ